MAEQGQLVRSEPMCDGVQRIELSRSQKLNAMTPAMLDELIAALEHLPTKTRVVLLQGAGGIFCPGFDLELCVQSDETLSVLLEKLSQAVACLRAVRVPVVVAIEKAAVAGGAALLGGVDIAVTHAEAKIGYPVLRLGISPGVSSPFMLCDIETGSVRELLLCPRIVSGKRAFDIGLVHDLVASREEVIPTCERIAISLAAKPMNGLSATKQMLRDTCGESARHIRAGLAASLACTGSVEQQTRIRNAWAAMQSKQQ